MKISFRTHETASNVRRLMPVGMYEEFYSFAFVRNPYSWLVSEFEVVRQNSDHRHYMALVKMKDFSEYIDWEVNRAKRYQYPLVTDEDGKIMVKFIGHFEYLRDDYEKVCDTKRFTMADLRDRMIFCWLNLLNTCASVIASSRGGSTRMLAILARRSLGCDAKEWT